MGRSSMLEASTFLHAPAQILVLVLSALAAGAPHAAGQGSLAAELPDFSGSWGHNGFGFEVPYVSRAGDVIDGHRSAYLKPWTAEVLLRNIHVDLKGRLVPNGHTTCWPLGTPGVVSLRELVIAQNQDVVVLLFEDDHQYRVVHLNQPHPKNVTPSWFGDSVGHFEGKTLVVDTVGFANRPQAAIDRHGTPVTDRLHVVERFRFVDEAVDRPPPDSRNPGAAERARLPGLDMNGRTLELSFTVEDPNVFRKPWTSTLIYKPYSGAFQEEVCGENERNFPGLTPTADAPDF
jgi:hypothetical protein